MEIKDIFQMAAPFIAVWGGMWLESYRRRERLQCFITHEFTGRDYVTCLAVHNAGSQKAIIRSVHYRFGLIRRSREQLTALDYEDPDELGFPYIIDSGGIVRLPLDERMAKRLADQVERLWLSRVTRRQRLVIECRTASDRRFVIAAEHLLPWKEQLPWLQE